MAVPRRVNGNMHVIARLLRDRMCVHLFVSMVVRAGVSTSASCRRK